ncbi:MAG TPA: hypothetical protein VJ623_12560 [Holophagaceae bacterium]|nr:hypothetical protein [Holophagaceae bacterium]
MSVAGVSDLREAQSQIDQLIQSRARLFAAGLLGLDLLYGLLHRSRLGLSSHPSAVALMTLSFLELAFMVIWLRRPRRIPVVNALAGTATLLAVGATLIHLHTEGRLWETTHLMLVAAGAGCFIYSLPWVALNLSLALGGWALYAFRARPLDWPYFAIDLLAGALLGLLLTFVRRDQIHMFRDLLLRDQRHAAEQHRMLAELKQAFDSIKTLRGLVPICASCKKIRDDRGYWHQVEAYIHQHSEATFTHGLCPRCADALRSEFEAVAGVPASAAQDADRPA